VLGMLGLKVRMLLMVECRVSVTRQQLDGLVWFGLVWWRRLGDVVVDEQDGTMGMPMAPVAVNQLIV